MGKRMATINIRVDDHIRDALDELASERGLSLSEHVRDVLRESVVHVWEKNTPRHGDEATPETLTIKDRHLFSLIHQVLAKLPAGPDEGSDRDEQEQHRRQVEVLREGFTGEYWQEFAGFATELSVTDTRRVMDILQMFRVVGSSVQRHLGAGVTLPDGLERRLAYRGFDHNDGLEGHMAAYVTHQVGRGLWSEQRPFVTGPEQGNSHMEMLPIYARMVAEFRRIMDTPSRERGRDEYLLSVDELAAIAGVRTHPDNR